MPPMKTILLISFILLSVVSAWAYQGYRCQLDGYEMRATGMTRITDTGKILYEYRCLNGHTAWVVK